MTLTVPRAGTIAGRAAQITVAQPETGGAIAEFGNRMLQHGMQWQAQQRAAKVQQDTLNFTRDMGAARLEAEQVTDPTQVGPTWDALNAEITAKYITPETDPEVAAELKLAMQRLGDQHALALSEKTINLGRSQQEAAWIESRAAITTEAATADPTTFQALIELGEAAIDDRVAKGLLDPAKGATEKQALRAEVYSARATGAISNDPAAALAAAEAGEYDALGAEGVAKLKLDAQGEIDRRTAAQMKADEVATKGRKTAVVSRLNEIGTLASAGRLVVDEQEVNSPEIIALAEADPDVAEARRKALGAISLRQEITDLDLLPVPALDELIAKEQSRQTTEGWENDRLVALTAMRDRKAAAYAKDPKAAAAASGLPAPPLPGFDPDAPEDFVVALSASVNHDAYLRENGYTKLPAIFTIEEKAALKPILDPKAEAGPKVALMKAILAGTNGNALPVLAELEADPLVRRGLKVLTLTGDEDLTKAILRGGQKVEEKTVLLPPEADQIRLFTELTGGTFSDAPVAVQKEVMQAALALYAESATGLDPAEDPDGFAEVYGTALQHLMGAQSDRSGALTVGGIQEVNGNLTVLPYGVGVSQVEDTFERLDFMLRGAVWDQTQFDQQGDWTFADPAGADPSYRMRAFTAASVYGEAPNLGSDPTAMLASSQLVPVLDKATGEPTGIYELHIINGSRTTAIKQANGVAYRFRLADLMRGAAQ